MAAPLAHGTLSLHLFNVHINDSEPLNALVVELVRDASLEELLEQVYKADHKRLALASLLIVRPPVATPVHPASIQAVTDRQIDTLPDGLAFLGSLSDLESNSFARFPDRPVHLLFSHEYTHYLSNNLNSASIIDPLSANTTAIPHVLSMIQRAEIDSLVDSAHARLPPIGGALYRAPSGDLVPSFLRVGNILRSRAALDALFFWLLPHLDQCIGIITDIWSIGAIALNTSRRLALYTGPAAQPCPVEMLGTYFDGSDIQATEAAEQIERLLRLARESQSGPGTTHELRSGRLLFLFSGINTGASYSRLCELLERRNKTLIEQIAFVALFNLGKKQCPMACLRDLSAEAGNGLFAHVQLSDAGEAPDIIDIDPQTYFPSQYKDVLHNVRKRHVKRFREFLDRYPDARLVRVHRDVTEKGAIRHHAIWIDTVALCSHPTFKTRFIGKLGSLDPPPRLIITPVHEAANILANVALSTLRSNEPSIEHIQHPDLALSDLTVPENERIQQLIDGLSEDASILVLDDAFITGRRLSTYQRLLRYRRFRGRVHYLVAVARPWSLLEWETQSNMLSFRWPPADQGNTVTAIEEFVLPDWAEADCPWCVEQSLYEILSGLHPQRGLTKLLRDRRQLLEQSGHTGLDDNLFIIPPTVANLSFTDGSIFAAVDMSQASVFASVASSLQTLRTQAEARKQPLGPRHYPVATVLDDKEYLEKVYTDSTLRACILRAAADYELTYTDQKAEERKTRRAIALLTAEKGIDYDLSAELIVAAFAGKFRKLNLADEQVKAAIDRIRLTDVFGELG